MNKSIIYLCFWFPPVNVIGALRPYKQVEHLLNQGYKVTVICSYFDQNKTEFIPSHKNLKIIRYKNNFINRILPKLESNSEPFIFQASKYILRNIFYPDFGILNEKSILDTIEDCINKEGKPSCIISSSLPFSMHTIASRVSKKHAIKWIADHRDLFANNPYRRRPKPFSLLDTKYESSILKHATYNTVVGNLMKEELSKNINHQAIKVIRNGADVKTVSNQYKLAINHIKFSYTGILYRGLRDPTPLFEAILLNEYLSNNSTIDFYGSESFVVSAYQEKFPDLNIIPHDKIPKTQVKKIQMESHFLIVALGNTEFEKTVLTGKFYEYLETGRAIIAICDEDSELASLINKYKLGVASRNAETILDFIISHKKKGFPMNDMPYELTREYQNSLLINMINA